MDLRAVAQALPAGSSVQGASGEVTSTRRPPTALRRASQSDAAGQFDACAADNTPSGKPTTEDPVYGRVQLSDGAHAVYHLRAVLRGRPESIPLAERDQGKLMLAQESGVGDFQAFVRSLYNEADIVVNEDVLAADDLFQ